MQSLKAVPLDSMRDDTKQPKGTKGTIRAVVKESLLAILEDSKASAAAKASAGRTLMEYFDEQENENARNARGADMTASELDDAIARLKR